MIIYRGEDGFPEDYTELAREADVIDSFAYPNLDAWRADTAANRIDRAIKASSPHRREHEHFLRETVFLLRDLPLAEVAEDAWIMERAARYAAEEEQMLDVIRKYGRALPEDPAGELFVVDTTGFSNSVRIDKKLIALVNPTARGYVEIKPVFRGGQKTFDVALSLSLALSMQHAPHTKNMGEIVRDLNLGDGHIGAAAGVWRCANSREFQKVREELPRKVLELWKKG